MTDNTLRDLLDRVSRGELSPADAQTQIADQAATAGFVELGHTKLDTHRRHRRGVAEAVYCAGKTPEQVLAIAEKLDAAGQTVICTRITPDAANFVTNVHPDFHYHPVARILWKKNEEPPPGRGTIAVVTAGTTDIPVAEEAALCAELWGNEVERIFDVGVAGVHRLFATLPRLQQARAIICAAGMEGALPSVVAGLVSCPVVAVPTSIGYGASFGGLAALLGMLNSCSGGISVVNIDNGFGAALVAHLINRP